MFTVTCPKKIGSVGQDFFFLFIYFFLTQMYMFGCHYASKARFYSQYKCLPLRTWLFFLVFFSTFHIKVQLFCFLLKFFENVKKKVYGHGVLERVGRVTVVNTTFFSP